MTEVAVLPETRAVAEATAPALLAWYDRHRRVLPWRSPAGTTSDPYAVWLSEIMLQQTTVAAVRPYFAAFLARWPHVRALAAAHLDEVLRAWAGLGYYSRARNLHACAQRIVEVHGGRFPADEKSLRGLPGVGAYTAAAIAAIAFGRRAVVVDGNVERVMARLFGIATPLPAAKPLLRDAMDRVTPSSQVGDFAQAAMDLGATICTPRKPACGLCPLHGICRAARDGVQLQLPVRAAKKAVPQRSGAVLVVRRDDGAVLVRQRPASGLFGGMTEFPSTAWSQDFDASHAPVWPDLLSGWFVSATRIGAIEHGLTHFTLTLHVYIAEVASKGREPLHILDAEQPANVGYRPDSRDLRSGKLVSQAPEPDGREISKVKPLERRVDGARWVTTDELGSEALPTLMRKVWAKVVSEGRLAAMRMGASSDQTVIPLDGPRDHPQPSPAPAGTRTRRRLRRTGRRTPP